MMQYSASCGKDHFFYCSQRPFMQGCNLWRNWFKLPPFCSQPVAALAGCQQRPERWRTEVLDLCTGSHKSSSFTRRKSCTSNNPVPVLRSPSKYGWMSCSLNESNLTQLCHKLQPCFHVITLYASFFVRLWPPLPFYLAPPLPRPPAVPWGAGWAGWLALAARRGANTAARVPLLNTVPSLTVIIIHGTEAEWLNWEAA